MAIGPIDYLGAMPQQDFLKDIQGGLQLGATIQNIRAQQDQQALAQQRAAQYKIDVAAAMKNPTPQAFANLALNYQENREVIKQAWEQTSEGERKAEGDTMAQAYSALLSGKPEIAQEVIQRQVDARKNSGMDTANYETALRLVKESPEQAKGMLGFTLAHITDPKTFSAQFKNLGEEQRAGEVQPFAKREAAAKAGTAESEQVIKAVGAKYADSKALQDIAKTGWDIKKIAADIDISKESNRIAALNAAVAREGNSLRRQELQLKVDEAKTKREESIREKVSGAESGAATIDNMLSTVDRLLKNPSLNDVVGSIEGRLPSVLSDEGADAIALMDTIGSQAFLSQLPAMKGLGALSVKEGDKLQAALTNLSRVQSESQVRANLKEAQRLMLKARQNLSLKTGVPLGSPDRPNAPKTGAEFSPPVPGVPTASSAGQKSIVVDY